MHQEGSISLGRLLEICNVLLIGYDLFPLTILAVREPDLVFRDATHLDSPLHDAGKTGFQPSHLDDYEIPDNYQGSAMGYRIAVGAIANCFKSTTTLRLTLRKLLDYLLRSAIGLGTAYGLRVRDYSLEQLLRIAEIFISSEIVVDDFVDAHCVKMLVDAVIAAARRGVHEPFQYGD
jgi:hypothetical protein